MATVKKVVKKIIKKVTNKTKVMTAAELKAFQQKGFKGGLSK